MFLNTLSRYTMMRFGIMLIMLALGAFMGLQFTGQAEPTFAQSPEQVTTADAITLSPAGTTATKRFDCTVSEVDEWEDNGSSILIGCKPNDGNIAFFAQSTADPKRAARILAITLTAVSLGKKVWIQYDPAATNVVGCKASNCRMIFGMGMDNP